MSPNAGDCDTICCHSNHGFNLTAHTQVLDPADLAKFQIDPAYVESTTTRLDERMSVASNVLG